MDLEVVGKICKHNSGINHFRKGNDVAWNMNTSNELGRKRGLTH